MDMFDFRARNYMNPSPMGEYGSNFNVSQGQWATPNPMPTPYTGMEIQGPMRAPNSFAQAPPVAEPAPFRGMEIQGPLGTRPGVSNEPPESPEIEQEETPKEFDIFEHMYNAPTPALEAYKRHIMSMPKQEDYRAGKMDRFIAGLTGAAEGLNRGGGAGYAAARGVVDQKYNQALQNYANQGQGLGTLAELESNDMKSKMNYAKTAMEQRRADTREAREGRRDDALNNLSKAQEEKMRAELGLVGKELERSPADGMLYVVDKGKQTRTPIGKFDLTPEEKAEIERKTHKVNAGVNLGNQKSLFSFERPQKQEDAIRLAEATSAIGTRAHTARRMTDAANPIPQSTFDFTAPSQHKIAFETALSEVLINNPGYSKFIDPNTNAINPDEAAEDKTGYQTFLTEVQNQRDKIIAGGARRQVGTPQVNLPSKPEVQTPITVQNPLSAPSVADTPERARAVQILKENNKPVTPEMIEWIMKQPAFKVQ